MTTSAMTENISFGNAKELIAKIRNPISAIIPIGIFISAIILIGVFTSATIPIGVFILAIFNHTWNLRVDIFKEFWRKHEIPSFCGAPLCVTNPCPSRQQQPLAGVASLPGPVPGLTLLSVDLLPKALAPCLLWVSCPLTVWPNAAT